LSTPEKWDAVFVKTFQQATLQLAQKALDNIPKQHRHYTTLTLTVNPEALEQVKLLTEEFRRNLVKLVEECENPSIVMHFNTQLFPVSQWEEVK
jgi:uncharacterized protein (TIGR02147 family)